MPKKLTQEEFITRSILMHGGRYNYDKVVYVRGADKVIITCPIHGDFLQIASQHLWGYGCKKCSDTANGKQHTKSFETFVKDAQSVHGDKYDYTKVEYKGNDKKITIICPVHGEFLQTPNGHLMGNGCPVCGRITVGLKKRKPQEIFIKEALEVHGGYYTYDKVHYVNALSKVIITCPKHGDFMQPPSDHLYGHGCSKCRDDKIGLMCTYTLDEYVELANKVHNNKYDYSRSIYINSVTKMTIICPIHGEFSQTPSMHLHSFGCSKCSCSIGEANIDKYLTANNIPHTHQYRDHNCRAKRNLAFDFAVFYDEAKLNVRAFIEFDGIQHFNVVTFFGGEERHKQTQKYDEIKNEYCLTNNIKLIRIPYYEMDNINSILDKELKVES